MFRSNGELSGTYIIVPIHKSYPLQVSSISLRTGQLIVSSGLSTVCQKRFQVSADIETQVSSTFTYSSQCDVKVHQSTKKWLYLLQVIKLHLIIKLWYLIPGSIRFFRQLFSARVLFLAGFKGHTASFTNPRLLITRQEILVSESC